MGKLQETHFGPAEISACQRIVQVAMVEDLGEAGDITSLALVPPNLRGSAWFVARRRGILAGLEAARVVLEQVDSTVGWDWICRDGTETEPGTKLARVRGQVRSLLAAERVALNLVQHLSGVATITRRFVDAVEGLNCRIYDTRKTTPGLRQLQKYAVRIGGGHNHRFGLFDAVLIKDNHIAAWRHSGTRPLADAVRATREATAPQTLITCEVESIPELEEVLPGKPDIVLLDNMPLEMLRDAVDLRNRLAPQILLEASGGITLETVRAIGETGIDRISVGALTHSATALDIALDFEE